MHIFRKKKNTHSSFLWIMFCYAALLCLPSCCFLLAWACFLLDLLGNLITIICFSHPSLPGRRRLTCTGLLEQSKSRPRPLGCSAVVCGCYYGLFIVVHKMALTRSTRWLPLTRPTVSLCFSLQ